MNALEQVEKLLGFSWRKWECLRSESGRVLEYRFIEHQYPPYVLKVIISHTQWEWSVSLASEENCSKFGHDSDPSKAKEICERMIDEMFPNHVGKLGKE